MVFRVVRELPLYQFRRGSRGMGYRPLPIQQQLDMAFGFASCFYSLGGMALWFEFGLEQVAEEIIGCLFLSMCNVCVSSVVFTLVNFRVFLILRGERDPEYPSVPERRSVASLAPALDVLLYLGVAMLFYLLCRTYFLLFWAGGWLLVGLTAAARETHGLLLVCYAQWTAKLGTTAENEEEQERGSDLGLSGRP